MNAVEIEEAVSALAEAPFDAENFPYDFLQAFGNNDAAIRKLKSGDTNKSDLRNGTWRGVLQRNKNNIHLLTCPPGEVGAAMDALRASPATAKHKARFILATDGQTIAAERFDDGEVLACDYKDLPNRFTFFLSLAGISTVKKIDENAFDIRATGRLNKLYVELLKQNPDWDTDARRHDLNHFFARLIFCFFAEDTGIFDGTRLFTDTVEKMTERNGSNVHEVLAELFRAMDMPREDRAASDLRPYAMRFPYVNGNLFGGSTETPRFNQSARNYLLFVGNLDWKLINPDIFGSMIQAVADDEERGALGMHYTSVPNILKVLNPLFLDDLRQKLEEAGDGKTAGSARKLLNLRNRLARIRVFDPACGSGNFLVIAYKEMRKIEAIINERRGEHELPSVIPSTNFRGIEIRHFAAEIARLALIIAKFQSDALHIGDLFARKQVLPLDKDNWITCDNALRVDWHEVMKDTIDPARRTSERLFDENVALTQQPIDFENAGGETYICGNPPYVGTKRQTAEQKGDLEAVFESRTKSWKVLDYVSGWFVKAADYGMNTTAAAAFVSTNSVCQGQQAPVVWPMIQSSGHLINFAHTSFKWANLAAHNAGVTVVIVGITRNATKVRRLFSTDDSGAVTEKHADNINAYLAPAANVLVEPRSAPLSAIPQMARGNSPTDGGNLLLKRDELESLRSKNAEAARFAHPFYGSDEVISGYARYCLWIEDDDVERANIIPPIANRIGQVREFRLKSTKASTRKAAAWPHRFDERKPLPASHVIAVPVRSSENRPNLPVDLLPAGTVIANTAFSMVDGPLWVIAMIASRLHLTWIAAVCGRLELRYSYTNTVGWNTFPVPALSEQNKADLTRCAEEILLAREAHFPATIADLYDPDTMPADLRAAHDRNDETLERIYIGRRFRNDTERLEKLFELYTQMAGKAGAATRKPAGRKKKA